MSMQGKKVTVAIISSIARLKLAGLNAVEAASFIGLSPQAVAVYYRIIDALTKSEPIDIRQELYSVSAVKEYCEINGYDYKTVFDQKTEVKVSAPQEKNAFDEWFVQNQSRLYALIKSAVKAAFEDV